MQGSIRDVREEVGSTLYIIVASDACSLANGIKHYFFEQNCNFLGCERSVNGVRMRMLGF